jgi:hypothetical protein
LRPAPSEPEAESVEDGSGFFCCFPCPEGADWHGNEHACVAEKDVQGDRCDEHDDGAGSCAVEQAERTGREGEQDCDPCQLWSDFDEAERADLSGQVGEGGSVAGRVLIRDVTGGF